MAWLCLGVYMHCLTVLLAAQDTFTLTRDSLVRKDLVSLPRNNKLQQG